MMGQVANLAEKYQGAAACIQSTFPKAHCASNALNLYVFC